MFMQENTGFLEPLCAIYEEKAKRPIEMALDKKVFAIHRIFKNHEIETIQHNRIKALTNFNLKKQLEDL